MATVVKRIDRGFRAAVERTSALAGSGVKVGLQATGSGRAGTGAADVLDIAIYNEFGTETIPARPFIGGAAQGYEEDVGIIMGHLAKKVQNGASPKLALETLGQKYEGMVKRYIRVGGGVGASSKFTPNAPSTIARKGSTSPLIDTGRMMNSIRYKVLK